MKSKQINFFLTPEDIQEVNEYLKKNKLLVIPQPIPTERIVLIDSLLTRTIDNEYKIRGQKYIARPEDKDKLIVEHIKEQNYYLIEMMNSPVIEFLYPNHTNNVLKSGRIYFIKDILEDSKDNVVMKNTEFLKTAENFFKWFKKTFQSSGTIPGYEGFLVSHKAKKWKQTGGELVIS